MSPAEAHLEAVPFIDHRPESQLKNYRATINQDQPNYAPPVKP